MTERDLKNKLLLTQALHALSFVGFVCFIYFIHQDIHSRDANTMALKDAMEVLQKINAEQGGRVPHPGPYGPIPDRFT